MSKHSRVHIAMVCVSFAALAPGAAMAACPEDLAANDVRFKQTIERLESVKTGTKAQKCEAYRSHVRIMEQGREVFQRCNTGLTQRENVGQMNDSIEDFKELIKRSC
jgi:hypothetical protein